MVWSPADERFQENLEAAKAYYENHWTLCTPRTATALDRPIGHWQSNLRRPGVLARQSLAKCGPERCGGTSPVRNPGARGEHPAAVAYRAPGFPGSGRVRSRRIENSRQRVHGYGFENAGGLCGGVRAGVELEPQMVSSGARSLLLW
ncbi:helicase associated domain-containing protein [Streptomyces sp. NPDC052043]|uniref:helicase associated domain-containing protein n=1 Tax=Streptomyces sp. NPDC052043 TaxID=3365684 RepID=UPI0037D1C21A